MIAVDRLEKHFGKRHEIKAVASATFRAADGEITGLLGPQRRRQDERCARWQP